MTVTERGTNVIEVNVPGPAGAPGAFGLSDGDKGDISVVAGVWLIPTDVISTFMRAVNLVTTEAGFKAAVNLEQGVDVQTYSAVLTAWAAKTVPSGTVLGTDSYDTDATLAANSDTKIATQKAIKTYVGNALTGLQWKQSVRAASTANVTRASAVETGDVLDGVTLATGDRILLKNQTAGAENGIYTVNASGTPTRATDADASAELLGAAVFVREGAANADTGWVVTNNTAITLETTAIVVAQFAGAGSVAGGAGITVTGNSVAISDAELVALMGLVSAANKVPVFTGSGSAALQDFLTAATSWTPVLAGTTAAGAGTYSSQVGRVVKIGPLVIAQGQLIWSAHTGTGNMIVTGLPYTNGNIQVPIAIYVENITAPASTHLEAVVAAASTQINLYSVPIAGGAAAALAMDTAGSLYFTAIYIV